MTGTKVTPSGEPAATTARNSAIAALNTLLSRVIAGANAHAAPTTPNWPLVVGAAAAAVVVGVLSSAVEPVLVLGLAGGLCALGLVAAAAFRPIVATYAYLATVPLIAGIERGSLIPLVRPNEALLVLVLTGAMLGAYLRFIRGDRLALRLHPIDGPLAAFLLLSTVWPVASLMLRGQTPQASELAAVLPVPKLIAIYLLVRLTVSTEAQLVRCIRLIVWPGATIAVIAILQTLGVGPVVSMLRSVWAPEGSTEDLIARGSTTLGHPIATGDVIIISLILLICCGVRGLLGRRERLILGLTLGAGVLAAGQFSTWISACVAGGFLAWRFPELRRKAVRFLPIAAVAVVIGAPAFLGRLAGFGELGWPQSWIVRWDNLASFYLPELADFRFVLGVSPDPVLQAPETWREVIYLESGYLQFLWVGGIPLLAAFIWLSVAVLRNTGPLTLRRDVIGACASALEIAWWFLLVVTLLDPHLTLRGTGDLLFALLAITTGRASAQRHAEPAFFAATAGAGSTSPRPAARVDRAADPDGATAGRGGGDPAYQ